MQYIVSLSEPYAIPNDEHALDYILTLAGYDSLEDFAEDMEDSSYLSVTAPDLAEELHDATLEDELDSDMYVDHDGNTVTYEDIEGFVMDMLNETYGEVEVAGSVFDTGQVLIEMDPIAFRCTVVDYMDGEYFDSWDEWHNAVA